MANLPVRPARKATASDGDAADMLFLRRNLQLTRAKLFLQVSALSEAEKTIDLLTEALGAAEEKATESQAASAAKQEMSGEGDAPSPYTTRTAAATAQHKTPSVGSRRRKRERKRRQKEHVEIALSLHDLCTCVEMLFLKNGKDTETFDGGATSRGSLTPATGETIDGAASQCASSEDDDYAGNPSVMQSLPHRADAARKSLVQFMNSLKPSSDDLVLLGGDDGFHGCTADGPTTATAESPPPLPVGAGGGRLQSIARNSAAAMAKACARIDTLEHDIMDMQDEILAKSSAFTDMQTHLNHALKDCNDKEATITRLNAMLEDRTQKLISLTFGVRHVISSARSQRNAATNPRYTTLTMQNIFNGLRGDANSNTNNNSTPFGASTRVLNANPLPSFDEVDELCAGLSELLKRSTTSALNDGTGRGRDDERDETSPGGGEGTAGLLKTRLRRQAQELREENLYDEIELREAELRECKERLEDYKDQLAVMNFERKMALATAQRESTLSVTGSRSPAVALAALESSRGTLNLHASAGKRPRALVQTPVADAKGESRLVVEMRELRARCEGALRVHGERKTSAWQDRNAAIVGAVLSDAPLPANDNARVMGEVPAQSKTPQQASSTAFPLGESALLNSEKKAFFADSNF